MGLESEQFATFVPADPPRAGVLAVWGDGQGSDELDESDDFEPEESEELDELDEPFADVTVLDDEDRLSVR